MGHQPLGLASPAAVLRAHGHDVRCLDLAVEPPDPAAFREADLVGISIPMHTAARLGIEVARRVRAMNGGAHVAFYGLYASPLHDRLAGSGLADSVVGGEYEPGLVALAERLAGGAREPKPIPGVGGRLAFDRWRYPTPDRSGLPGLERYARLRIDGELRLAGYVEASRGCAHTCRHCPITPVYGGRLRLAPRDAVLADIDRLIELGAEHITFGDPDFMNAVPHSLAIAEDLHRRHPMVTFDATIKVEHLIEQEAALPRLRELGCLFVTSAFESTNDGVLRLLQKGHTRADMGRVVETMALAGLPVRPTWVAFTPWTTASDLLDLFEFVEAYGLVGHVQPVQYTLRLLLPPGSPLIDTVDRQGLLGPFDSEGLTHIWTNPDPRVEALQREFAEIVGRAASAGGCGDGEPGFLTFDKLKRAAVRALTGREAPLAPPLSPPVEPPGLTEDWFCCAEPTLEQMARLSDALGRELVDLKV